jgi:hypothetical protein
VKLETVTETTAELDVPFAGQTLHLAYRPYAVTTRDTVNPEQTPEEMVRQAARTIAQWDLTQKGKPVPLTEDGLLGLPIALVAAIVVAIAEDLQRDPNPPGSA